MRLKDVYQRLKRIRKDCRFIGIGIFFLALAPMVIVTLTAIREKEEDTKLANSLGIIWIIICCLFMIGFLGCALYHIIQYIKKENKVMHMTNLALEFAKDTLLHWKHTVLFLVICGIVLIAAGTIPILTVSMMRSSNQSYIALSYATVFVCGAAGLGLITQSMLLFFFSRSLQCKADDSIEENLTLDPDKIRKKTILQMIYSQLGIVLVLIILGFIVKKGMILLRCFLGAEIAFIMYILLCKPFGKWKYLKKLNRGSIVMKAVAMAACIFLMITGMYDGTWYIQPYIATIPSVDCRQCPITYDEETGIYSIQNPDDTDFNILQLTDIHLGGSIFSYEKDMKALEAVYDLIEYTKPDLVVVTGDFVFPVGIESFSFNNYLPMMQFASYMRNIGIPWTFTYGNHDTEFVASHTSEEINELFSSFSFEKTKNLLYTTKQPDMIGRSNQMIQVLNADGSINQLLFLIDSNSYAGSGLNDYDYIHDDQVQWYEDIVNEYSQNTGHIVSSLIFTHIPIKEYQEAYNLFKNGSNEVKYYHGVIGESGESICCSKYESKLFSTAVRLKSTKGIFAGHDHYNNISLEYKGIRLSYGMSIDYLAMPGIAKKDAQRGATLITLKQNSDIDIKNIPLNEITKNKLQ